MLIVLMDSVDDSIKKLNMSFLSYVTFIFNLSELHLNFTFSSNGSPPSLVFFEALFVSMYLSKTNFKIEFWFHHIILPIDPFCSKTAKKMWQRNFRDNVFQWLPKNQLKQKNIYIWLNHYEMSLPYRSFYHYTFYYMNLDSMLH